MEKMSLESVSLWVVDGSRKQVIQVDELGWEEKDDVHTVYLNKSGFF